jgi:AcrR family transcriptional regulator
MTAVQRRPLLGREFIEASRRRSFARAAAELAHEFGVHGVTVTLICRTAHSARNTFYEHFENVNACLRYGVREGFEQLFGPLRETDADKDEWLLDVERAIAGIYGAAAAEPLLAEMVLIHSHGVALEPGDPDLDAGVSALAVLLARGRSERPQAGEPMPFAEDYLARVIVFLAALKVRQEEAPALPAETREMALLVGTSYLGIEETARILAGSDFSR